MSAYNRIIMVGNLTRDPEYRQLPSGQGLCRLGLASNRQFKNRQSGDMVQEVCFVDIDVWGPQAESCRQYLQKGRPVLVEGRLKFDSWDDANGQKRSKHSIVADRVVFLSAGAQAEQGADFDQMGGLDPQNPVERDLMNQIDQIKGRAAAKSRDGFIPAQEEQKPKAKRKEAPAGEINFNDEPPFQDDLPF